MSNTIRDENLAKARALISAGRALEALIETSTPDLTRLYVTLHVQPGHAGGFGDPAEVDAIAAAIAGTKAATRHMGSGRWHHAANANLDGVAFDVLCAVPDPAAVDKDAELARLRAELAAARSELAEAYQPEVRKQRLAATAAAVLTPDADLDPETAARHADSRAYHRELAAGVRARRRAVAN